MPSLRSARSPFDRTRAARDHVSGYAACVPDTDGARDQCRVRSQREDLALTIGGPRSLRYHGTIGVRALDLGRVLDKPDLATHLNGKIDVDGSGVDLHRIYGSLHAVLDTSTFPRVSIRNAEAQVPRTGPEARWDPASRISSAEYHLTAALDESADLSHVSLTGTASGVDLSELTGDERPCQSVEHGHRN